MLGEEPYGFHGETLGKTERGRRRRVGDGEGGKSVEWRVRSFANMNVLSVAAAPCQEPVPLANMPA